jgi:hypothetical protein
MAKKTIQINRAPVLTLWAAVVAERQGHDRLAALTLGKALAGLNAQSKGKRLGIFGEAQDEPDKKAAGKSARAAQPVAVPLLGREVPALRTRDGLRALDKDKAADPASVERYLRSKFGDDLDEVQAAFQDLAKSYPPEQLEIQGFKLYERFRPSIPEGTKGWGAKGELDLGLVRELAKKAKK